MAFVVNDKRAAANPGPIDGDAELEAVRSTNPERTYEVVLAAMRAYLRARCWRTDKSADKSGLSSFTIPSPEHKIVAEIARYVVEGLLKSGDPRAWQLMPATELRTGDVTTVYMVPKAGGEPRDLEVTVLGVETAAVNRKLVIKYRGPDGGYDKLPAPPEYLFYVHRPAAADVLRELDGAP